ncbi:MAG: tetratricopeptide repeat protein [Candidatus Hydrogenedentota bacterium]
MQKTTLACLALILVTLLVFGQVYTFEFIGYDDAELVPQNPALQQETFSAGIREAFKPYFANWIPVTTITYLVDHAFYGFDPAGYHVTNLIFHTINVLLVFVVFRYLTGQFWFSMGLALLFAIHPSRVEAVAWVSERKGLVSTTFMLASIGTYAAYAKSSRKSLYAVTAVLLALSLMSKSMAVTLPFVFLLLDGWPLGRHGDCNFGSKEHRSIFLKLCIEKIPFLAIVIGSIGMTMLSQYDSGSVSTLSDVSVWMRATNTFYGYGAYLSHTVWPVDLIPFYPHHGDRIPLWKPAIGLILVVLISAMVIAQMTRRPYLLVGWFWFVGMLIPVIGIIQVGAQAYADRYLYVPLLGLGIMIFGMLSEWRNSQPSVARGLFVSCGVLLSSFAFAAWSTTGYWRDDIQLFSYVVEVDDENIVGHTILGDAYLNANLFEESRHHLERALELDNDHPPALYALGTLYLRQSNPAATSADSDAMAANSATRDQLENNIGGSYIMRQEYDLAEPHLLKALKLNPENAVAMTNLAIVRFSLGDRDEALELAEQATELDPDYTKARSFLEYVQAN